MVRDRFPTVARLIAAIGGVAAIALAAATVDSPVEFGGSGGAGTGDGSGTGLADQPPADRPVETVDVPPFLEYLVYALLIFVTIVVVWYLLTHRRDALRVLALCLLVALFVFAVVQVAPELFPPEETVEEPGSALAGGGDDGFGTGDGDAVAAEPIVAFLVVVTVIVVGGLLISRHDGSETADGEPAADAAEPDERGASAAAVGSAAGRAADRLSDATDIDNEIYRAWREMTRPLEVDRPESSTPREFAQAAIDVGLERDHVEELTRLFEDVRYGHEEPTPEMERRATTVLREIELVYAESDGDATVCEDGAREVDR
ncbi:DUF4129 domain-containing protein [Natronobacterium gregoryi]|uniref:DUF4129 domain-containing protein n=2 Tax=Natronobacterium gregoryi TaxID=44930 RepID=L0AIT7_NATGS|nr:DUF4129 domain-containing protein [Natronobacterium gregoryi]AFZ73706.1 hypothetical protein Natgr_2549 [Natronobacterium gregoryi SP2]PLK19574.1 DUF4129 domain-containing protein [Natronobacterium gregoryi SP2]SFJ01629.1 protein of unknown function [Natronobacterium gregoryi]